MQPRRDGHTWTLARHSEVRFPIRDPDTPGGFRLAMACRPASRSATADAMVVDAIVMPQCLGLSPPRPKARAKTVPITDASRSDAHARDRVLRGKVRKRRAGEGAKVRFTAAAKD